MKKIPLTQGKFAIVDDDDFVSLSQFKWCAMRCTDGSYYAASWRAGKNGKLTKMHRLIAGAARGQFVDHANGDTLDNRRANLRICSRSQNGANRKKRAGFTSKYLGVSWYPYHGGKWKAQITFRGKVRHIGYYKSEVEAAKAYDTEAARLHEEFARPNFNRSDS